ncbi:hypothetical protein CDD82_6186 [Ophiocordyceps australis]|uniref:C3H1-type domain-containing protein n=1 Tax=Ophiocordyceps australis TaxID=1399860 RepID=A0A2C5YWD5_9HYPO|nr:hypothetical protein CDD82_6186 [Ophiocordyceps australis]
MAENARPQGRRPAIQDQPSKPCFNFQRQGNCKFGDRCKFSHGIPGTHRGELPQRGRLPTPSSDKANIPGKRGEGKLREWKRLLVQGSLPARPSSEAVARFFQLGLELMDGDLGATQEAVKLLATEPGLSLIREMSDKHVQAAMVDGPSAKCWTFEVKPLFQVMTHPRVVDSAVLEQEVAAIFNFLLGVGGSRMTRVLGYTAQLVESWTTEPEASASRIEAIELSLAVLSKIMDCNTSSIVSRSVSDLFDSFAAFLDQESLPREDYSRLQASMYLEYIRLRLEVGGHIPALQNQTQVPIARESFVLQRDLPGHLSAEGPRHDNDHALITDIKILPTNEEIMSSRGEYLPTSDPSQWHFEGIRGRLDREFRLLREDTVGQLRDTVRETLELMRNPNHGPQRLSKLSVRTNTYDNATLVNLKLDRIGGLEILVRCHQPSMVHKMTDKKRKDWWMQSKRLQTGALVCILNAESSALFFTVSDSTMRERGDKKARRTGDQDMSSTPDTTPQCFTLSCNKTYLYVTLQLVDAGRHEIGKVLQWYGNKTSSLPQFLVEFPGILLASFKHTLEALKQMYEKPIIPFSNLLAPSGSDHPAASVDPPMYARKAGFTFDLKCLTNDETQLVMSPQRPLDAKQLATRSTLDSTQAAALINTLSRELSLIQGPPGTGKSYTGEKIIKVLLANKERAKIGPILCVCYTNHALDQLLEHLLDDGTEHIIRIGSRSKSERLQDLNLRTVVRGLDRTKSEKSGIFQVEEAIRNAVRDANASLEQLSASGSWRSVKQFLAAKHPSQHNELFGDGKDGWQVVNHSPENIVARWLAAAPPSQVPDRPLEALTQAQLSTMNAKERRRVHGHWLKKIRDPIILELQSSHRDYSRAIERRDRVRGDIDLRCLQQANVVGITTTGLARNLNLLRKLRSKVMLCEEAGEVLEAHLLTALLPSVEHAILIGDHLQLRPQVQNYELQSTNPRGQQYSLDMSLFERLVRPLRETDLRLPFCVLETQRRMHPSIAELIRATLYPNLEDADKVMQYPKVMGMKQRLFWLHHEYLETAATSNDPVNTSHTNTFEVDMTIALVSHLVRQGEYAPGDIAVLTPYLAQLQLLRRIMETMFEICVNERDLKELETLENHSVETALAARPPVSKATLLKTIRAATVDNFQGEEAKVIVVSLVRSNPDNRCGFLGTPNRINVLLSRAQHGMYIIGNSNTCKHVPMWSQVIDILRAKGQMGTSLELQCPRHPETPLAVSKPDHFLQFSPESGCILPCEKRLQVSRGLPSAHTWL